MKNLKQYTGVDISFMVGILLIVGMIVVGFIVK